MITEENFQPEHWNEIKPQQGITVPLEPSRAHLELLASQPIARTLRTDGRVVAFLGFFEYWPGRGECWAVIDEHSGPVFVGVHRVAHRLLHQDCRVRRVEAIVECSFLAGHRWARILGFTQEAARMRHYYENGKDCSLYARVKE
jgi:hypothetical protein